MYPHLADATLEAMTFEERQQLLRLVVERITVEDGRVRIETIMPRGSDGVPLRILRPERSEGSGEVAHTPPDASLRHDNQARGPIQRRSDSGY